MLSLLLLVGLCPLLVLLFALIRLDSPGRALFCQWRVGKGHKLFKLYKFRTMHVGSEKYAELLRDDGVFVRQDGDPRVTKIGAVLRRMSLDELPQLYNIVRGDMAVIGPRPLVLAESNRLPSLVLTRLNVRPGLTGYAQVEGRGDAELVDRCARDVYYVKNISIWLDLRILMRTLTAVLHREGAY